MKRRDWLTLTPLFFKCLGKLPTSHLLYLARQFRHEYPHRHDGKLYINAFFPPYPSKPFDRFLANTLQGKRVPYSVYFGVTDRCPFKCAHCSYGMHREGRLTTEQAIDVIGQIKSLSAATIGFTGGEPLMRDDLVELVRAVGEDMSSVLFTTGHRLTEELARELKHAGLDTIMIGLESDDLSEHDGIRGVPGSFSEALSAVALSRDAGFHTAISTVATKQKIADGKIERMAELAARHGVHEFRILEPVPTGRFHHRKDQILSQAESKQLADFHKQWNRGNRRPAISAFSHLESDEMFGCGAAFHHLFIDALGNVCPCDLTPLSFGNVLEQPLEDIWSGLGELFPLPRRGCLMYDLCKRTDMFEGASQLPLSPQESASLCRTLPTPTSLPGIYSRLFKDRKPTNPPASRR
ncbi:MAG: radical SAM/SPASM domain-containing protein [Planctomycetota bacterium]